MKRIIIACSVLFLFLSGIPVFADTITDALMEQARVEGERINAVQRALWLRWLDQYNKYIVDLTSGVASPAAPAWSTDMAKITSYLPTGFPSANYALALSGDEITVTRNGMTPEVAMYVPLYVPLATLPDATTVQLLVTRPTTFVGTEALTRSLVRNSGLPIDPLTSTTFLPGANVTFGNGASMEMQGNGTLWFTGENGQIRGVSELHAARIVPVDAAAGLTIAVPVTAADGLTIDAKNTSITGDLSIQGGSLRLGNDPSYMNVTVSNAGEVTFSGSSFAFTNPLSMQGELLDSRFLRTGADSTLNSTISMANGAYIQGSTGDAQFRNATATNVTAANITATTQVNTAALTLNGRTGTSTNPYDVYVTNSNLLNGKTAAQIIEEASAASGPSGLPVATSVYQKTSGNYTLAVSSARWYKVEVQSAGEGAGKGVKLVFYVKPSTNTTWSIVYHAGGPGSTRGRAGGGTFEIKDGTTTIAIPGAGGGSGRYGPGGAGGIPTIDSTAISKGYAAAAGGYGYGNEAGTKNWGGAASSGTRTGYNVTCDGGGSGAGWTRGNANSNDSGGGGGSSYLKLNYGKILIETPPAASSGNSMITIWEYR